MLIFREFQDWCATFDHDGDFLRFIRGAVNNHGTQAQHPMLHLLAAIAIVTVFVYFFTGICLGVGRRLPRMTTFKQQKQISSSFRFNQVPGALPLLGHWHKIGSVRNLINVVEPWCDQYAIRDTGVLELNLVGHRVVVVCREDRLLELLPHRVPDKMTRPPQVTECARAGGVTGLFAAEGEQWRTEHRLVHACLNHANLQDYLQAMKTVTVRLMDKWKTECETTESIPILETLGLAATDILALITIKQDFDSLRNTKCQVVQDLHTIVRGAMRRTISPVWYWRIPIIGQYLDGCGWALQRMQKTLGGAVDAQQDSFQKLHTNEGGEDNSRTFLQKLLGLTASGKTKLARHRLTGQVMTLFFAGIDTSSKTITHALYLLAQDQTLQQTLRDEVDSAFPGDSLQESTLDDLCTKLPRIKSFVHEFHRHHGSPVALWYTTAEIPFCGTVLPKGTNLMIMKHYMSCNTIQPSVAVPIGPSGEPPSEFCAERFVVRNEDGSLTPTPDPSTYGGAFGGFGHGLRQCPGRGFAEAVTYLTIASMLQTFEWDLALNHPQTTIILDLIQMLDKEVQLRLVRRSRLEL